VKKPFGIIMVAVYTAFAGIFSVALPVNGFVADAVVNSATIERIEFPISILVGSIAFGVCCGLWNMPLWGLWLGRIYYSASILLSFISVVILKPKEGFFGLEGLFMLIEAGILLYLLQLNRSTKRSLLNYPAESLE
jgi:peptidoglycan/LPS O-acetylase OafA/YrhL